MQNPADLVIARGVAGLAAGVATPILTLPAIANHRYRIWFWSAGPWDIGLGAGQTRFYITNSGGFAFDSLGWAIGAGVSGGQHFFPGGYPWVIASEFVINGLVGVLGQYFVSVGYTTEQVT